MSRTKSNSAAKRFVASAPDAQLIARNWLVNPDGKDVDPATLEVAAAIGLRGNNRGSVILFCSIVSDFLESLVGPEEGHAEMNKAIALLKDTYMDRKHLIEELTTDRKRLHRVMLAFYIFLYQCSERYVKHCEALWAEMEGEVSQGAINASKQMLTTVMADKEEWRSITHITMTLTHTGILIQGLREKKALAATAPAA